MTEDTNNSMVDLIQSIANLASIVQGMNAGMKEILDSIEELDRRISNLELENENNDDY